MIQSSSSARTLYRMKGVLSVRGSDRKFVYQAVHMSNVGGFTEPWADGEARVSKLTFIGKDLDRAALQADFEAAMSDQAAIPVAPVGKCASSPWSSCRPCRPWFSFLGMWK